MKTVKYIGSPSRNFCILGSTKITDPLDGREKFVLSNYASRKTGSIVIIDPETNEGEQIFLPNDNGAWAIYNYHDEFLLIGCCMTYGSIHTFDLKTRKFIKTQNIPGDNYIYAPAEASDKNVYFGSFPNCSIIKYDVSTHTASRICRASERKSNLYSRGLVSDIDNSGLIAVNCVMEGSEVAVYDVYSEKVIKHIDGEIRRVGDKAVEIVCGDEKKYFSRKDFEELSAVLSDDEFPKHHFRAKSFSNGTFCFPSGQHYTVVDEKTGTRTERRIPVIPPSTALMTIACDEKGKIWGSSEFGMTICCLDPDTGEYTNTDEVTEGGGEVYGIVGAENKIFLTSYVKGSHIVYDPALPFNQKDNINPKTLFNMDKIGYARPHAKSIIGPDGKIWTGLWANYGIYGGALTKLDPKTEKVEYFESPVKLSPEQVFTDGKLVYVTTTPGANGLRDSDKPMHLYAVDTDFNMKHDIEMPDFKFGPCVALGGKLFVSVFSQEKNEHHVMVYSPELEFIGYNDPKIASDWWQAAVKIDDEKAVICMGKTIAYLYADGHTEKICDFKYQVHNIAVSPEGRIFLLDQADIYEIIEE